jgi:hypothetical protein
MSDLRDSDKVQQIPSFYKKKSDSSRFKTILLRLMFPFSVLAFVAIIFVFWKWLFMGVGIDPQQYRVMLYSSKISESRSAIVEWGQAIKTGQADYPKASVSDVKVVEELVFANIADFQLVNSGFWVLSSLDKGEFVESKYCEWLKKTESMDPAWIAENLVPVQAHIVSLPCFELFENWALQGKAELRWAVAAIIGQAKKQGLQIGDSLFESFMKDSDSRLSLLAGIGVWDDSMWSNAVDIKVIEFFRSRGLEGDYNNQDKIIIFKIFARISENPGVLKNEEIKEWILRFANEAKDLAIRGHAIKLRQSISALRQ